MAIRKSARALTEIGQFLDIPWPVEAKSLGVIQLMHPEYPTKNGTEHTTSTVASVGVP